jgi:hypothetical protein
MTERGMFEPVDSREWWCRLVLRALAASFVIVGALFLFLPDTSVQTMNATGRWLGDFPPAPASALRFWLVLATGYMALVAALAYVAQRDLRHHRDLVALLALGKAVTSLTGLAFYVFSLDAFVYLATFLVDGGIALTALRIWFLVPSLGSPVVRELAPESAKSPDASSPVIRAVLEAMVPPGGPFEEGAVQAAVAEDVEAFVAGVAPSAARALRFYLRLLDYSPFFLPPLRLRRFSGLDLDERVQLLEAWEQSRLPPRRQAIHMLKALVMLHFYSRPEVEARLGYPYPLDRVPRGEAAS